MSSSTLGNAAGPGVCKRGGEVAGYKRQVPILAKCPQGLRELSWLAREVV